MSWQSRQSHCRWVLIMGIPIRFVRWSWWRHQMDAFSALLAFCVGISPATGEFPTQRPVTWSFDIFFDLRPNKRLSKQSRGWWFESPSRSLWRHRNAHMHGESVLVNHIIGDKPSYQSKAHRFSDAFNSLSSHTSSCYQILRLGHG